MVAALSSQILKFPVAGCLDLYPKISATQSYIQHLASTVLRKDCKPVSIYPQVQRVSGMFEADGATEQSFLFKGQHLPKQAD